MCQKYITEKVVRPPTMRGSLFTTTAIRDIDHKPISTTDKDSFHGTGIRVIQHPTTVSEGVHRGVVALGGDTSSKTDGQLPHYYTDVIVALGGDTSSKTDGQLPHYYTDVIVALGGDTSSKTDGQLPHYYFDALPVASSIKELSAPASSLTSLIRSNCEQDTQEERKLLENARRHVDDPTEENPKIHIGLHTTQGGSHLEMEQSHPLNCFLHFTTSLTLWQ